MSEEEVIEKRVEGWLGVFNKDGSEYEKFARYTLEGDEEIVNLVQKEVSKLKSEMAFGIGEKDE